MTPLYWAVLKGYVAIVGMLIEQGATIDKTDGLRSHIPFYTLLYLCVTLIGGVFSMYGYRLLVHYYLVIRVILLSVSDKRSK